MHDHYLTLPWPHLKNHGSIHYPFPATCLDSVIIFSVTLHILFLLPTMSFPSSRKNPICLLRSEKSLLSWSNHCLLCFCTTTHIHCFSIYYMEGRGATDILKHPTCARPYAKSHTYFPFISSNWLHVIDVITITVHRRTGQIAKAKSKPNVLFQQWGDLSPYLSQWPIGGTVKILIFCHLKSQIKEFNNDQIP